MKPISEDEHLKQGEAVQAHCGLPADQGLRAADSDAEEAEGFLRAGVVIGCLVERE